MRAFPDSAPRGAPSFLSGGGELGERMRALDWSSTALGPAEAWPQALRTSVSICLNSCFPILIWWGPKLVKLYNDAYARILGSKHPAALGAEGRKVWPEIWSVIGPMLEGVLERGEATWSEDILLHLERSGFAEETYFTFSYSPIRDDAGAIGGAFSAISETTRRVLAERRFRALGHLSGALQAAVTPSDVLGPALDALATNAADLPFGAIYRIDPSAAHAHRVASCGELPASLADLVALEDGETGRAFREALRSGVPVELGLQERGGPPSPKMLVLPLAGSDANEPTLVLVAGLSPTLLADDEYRTYLALAAQQIGGARSRVSALEAARARAESLAELDRAKTTFFSNVSHEFRTPLTLILGSSEELLAEHEGSLNGEQRERLGALHRNSQRLLKLVNTLLEFSRIESGRARANLVPTDLSAATADAASTFRSAFELAGLSLEVDCPPLGHAVRLDRDMWERVILNLLSNALKFTFTGGARVSVREAGDAFVVAVSDTGTGIPREELPNLFKRFHRVHGAQARTHEGSGIGLALVEELVRMHGGTVRVDSELGRGTTFEIRFDRARAEPLQELSASAPQPERSRQAAPFVSEALRWIPSGRPEEASASQESASQEPSAMPRAGRLLLADDNADMREHVARLLTRAGWRVETAADGEEALARARAARPDLILSDVMMPKLDGLELMKALRADPALRSVPVILLSARAGEGEAVTGIAAGAEDYLVKPFSARELLARVRTRLEVARARAEMELARERLHAHFMRAPVPVCILTGPELRYELANQRYLTMIARDRVLGRTIREVFPELPADAEIFTALERVYRTGEPFLAEAFPVRLIRSGLAQDAFFHVTCEPIRDAFDHIEGVMIVAVDVTAQAQIRRELERLAVGEREARARAELADQRKDEFLAVLGHELRNPLAPISTALQLLELRGVGAAEREREVIRRQVDHLVRLVDDLLDVSRVTRGKVELKKETLELGDLVARSIEMVSPLIEARGHRLEVEIPQDDMLVEADATRLAQVFSNLLANAAKYTDRGGHIRVTAQVEDGRATVSVRDDGAGIAPDMLPRIFEMFAQEQQSLERSAGGLGLGLTIARSLVELHGGTLEARSEGRGKGSEFRVTLPRVSVRPAAPPRVENPFDPTEFPGTQVLVVDDNRDAAELLAETLEQLGYRTRVAHDGPEALNVLDGFSPTICLLDIGLPVMDGYELASRLRTRSDTADARLVAITGYGQDSDRARSRQARFDAHLVKPVDVNELSNLLNALLRDAAPN